MGGKQVVTLSSEKRHHLKKLARKPTIFPKLSVMDSKILKFNKVAYIILQHEITHGHLKWKISAIAEAAGVSRSWIYKYYGREKEEILYLGLITAIDDFLCISEERQALLREKGVVAALEKSRDLMIQYPEINAFYQKFSNSRCRYGKIIRAKEKEYTTRYLMGRYGFKNEFQAYLFRSVLHGVGAALFIPREKSLMLMMYILSKEFHDWVGALPDVFESPGLSIIHPRKV